MNVPVISFYCDTDKSGYYKKASERLSKNCGELGIRHYIDEIPSKGSWIANTKQKPVFILSKLKELQEPVLWLDVDQTIMQPMTVIDTLDCDVAASRYRSDKRYNSGWHVRIGVIYFNHSPAAIRFLEQWIAACNRANENPNTADKKVPSAHPLFVSTWRDARDNNWAKLHVLPYTYSDDPIHTDENTVIAVGLSGTESKLIWKKNNKQGYA